MTEHEQRRIFAENLKYYIALNKKTQKEVASDIGESPQSVNNWCKGIAMPSVSKIQKLADYFRIGKSDLVDDKLIRHDTDFEAMILNDANLLELIKRYTSLSAIDKETVEYLINSLYAKSHPSTND